MQSSAVAPLRQQTLDAIRAAAANGSLIGRNDLVYVLYRWRDLLDGNVSEVRKWTDARLLEDSSVVALAREFTGRSWSMGMGDRVSKSSTVAQIDDDTEIIDSKTFHARLEEVAASGKLDQDGLQAVQTLIDAWNRKRAGRSELFD